MSLEVVFPAKGCTAPRAGEPPGIEVLLHVASEVCCVFDGRSTQVACEALGQRRILISKSSSKFNGMKSVPVWKTWLIFLNLKLHQMNKKIND